MLAQGSPRVTVVGVCLESEVTDKRVPQLPAIATGAPPSRPWHTLSVSAAMEAARTTAAGLSRPEAASRLVDVGPNRLQSPRPVPLSRIFKEQLSSVVVFLLVIAGVVSVALSDYFEAAAIAIVLVINTGIGFTTEWRARRAMEALRGLDVPRASVVRDGHLQTVNAETLVPGDLIEIAAGHRVPADGRLILASDLRVMEAALTGESLPVSKAADPVLDDSTPLAERTNMVFKSAAVVAGVGRAIVTGTGASTEVGRIGTLVDSVVQEHTPLERKLDALGRRLVWITVAVAALVSLLGALHGAGLLLVIETGVALAVAAVPEALPAVVTIALAVGMRRMARRGALVRRLPAVETLGSTTVVCTDKTRTLTSGDMTLVRVWSAGREWDVLELNDGVSGDVRRTVEIAALASRHQTRDRDRASLVDPVDAAILQAAECMSGPQAPVIDGGTIAGMVPFSSGRKFMAVIYDVGGGLTAFAKGAPGRMIERSGRVLTRYRRARAHQGAAGRVTRGERESRSKGITRPGGRVGRSARHGGGRSAQLDACRICGPCRSSGRRRERNHRGAADGRAQNHHAHRRPAIDG